MAITIQNSKDNADDKTVSFTIAYGGKDYKWHGDIPKDVDAQDYLDAKSDTLKAEILRKEYKDAEVPQLDGKSDLESFEAWVSAGAKNAEVSQEIPAVVKKAAVYEDVETEPAIEAKDAVMGERQKELSEEEEVTKTVIEKSEVSGKYLEKEVTETVVKKIPQYEEVPLYAANGKAKKDDDGNAVMHTIPKMEEYEVEPAFEAKAAVTERQLVSEAVEAVAKQTLVIKPEETIEKKSWVDTH
jgi:hypothetical protein